MKFAVDVVYIFPAVDLSSLRAQLKFPNAADTA